VYVQYVQGREDPCRRADYTYVYTCTYVPWYGHLAKLNIGGRVSYCTFGHDPMFMVDKDTSGMETQEETQFFV
jgi:hypothetical protein